MTVREDPLDAELKARHRAMWAMGDYPAVAADVIPDLGSVLVEACGIQRDDTVLDVACGSGNAAIPAALRSAHVTACDLTPALLETGRLVATSLGANVSWQEGDAESLPFGDASFDVVLSCVGVMFAPHHQTSADELFQRTAQLIIGAARNGGKQFIGELPAERSTDLRYFLYRGQPIEPRRKQPLQARRDRQRRQRAGQEVAALLFS